MEILENLIGGFKKMMGEGKTTSVPISPELYLDKGISLASFYYDREKQEVIMIPSELNPNDDLQEKINEIVKVDRNEIDRIFFANVGKQGSSSILRVSEESSSEDRHFDWKLLERILGGVESLEATVEELDRGELDYTLFKFGNNQNGGILSLSIVPKSKPKLWLGFVSGTHEGERKFLNFRETYLPEILELFKKDMPEYYSD